jgi:hypothetical protein
MRDPETFARLFRIPLPRPEWVWHYVDTLARSAEYAELPRLARAFEALEASLAHEEAGVALARKRAITSLNDHISGSRAYARMLQAEHQGRTPRFDRRMEHHGAWLVSVDIRKANDSTLRMFDEDGELGEDWASLCAMLEVPAVLAQSKTQGLFAEADVVLQLHDEFVVRPEQEDDAVVALIRGIELAAQGAPVPFVCRAQRFTPLDRGYCVVEHAGVEGDALRPTHASLFKVPGNLFYPYFRRHVLEEPLQEKDLYFRAEGHLARWAFDEHE